uniref:unspecific monooxygenase n=1 Tax=Plectus sambesii TaxID=2011161 RepID=A0A914XN23_9BILA
MNVTLTNLSKVYGPVYQLQMGSRRFVIVNGQKAVREGLTGTNGSDIAARPELSSYEGFGIFGEPGYRPSFKMYKKLTVQAMTMFGNHRRSDLQEVAYRAIDMLMTDLKAVAGQPYDSKPTLYRVIWTIMGFICYGRFFNQDDPEVLEILQTADGFGKSVMFGVISDYLPWTKPLMKKQLMAYKRLTETIQSQSVKLARQNFQSWDGTTLRTVADMFRKTHQDMSEAEKEEITDEQLLKMLNNIFGAGFGTIATTVKWSILLLAKHQDIQVKMQQELDSVLGDDQPTFDDQTRLPFCTAVLAEVYRVSSMAALAMTHMTLRDVKLCGVSIPKETPVVFNLYSSHFDESAWKHPHQFDPYRFIDRDSHQLNKTALENVVPYGLGPRRCGGEHLARLEIFIFFVSIFHQCEIEEAPGEKLDPEDYTFGLGIDPRPFRVVYKSRRGLW